MQQTTKYQFNLVDATDDFSPDPLNQNMEKVEEALAGQAAALEAAKGEFPVVRLGSYTAATATVDASFDLSGVDMGQFAYLELWVGGVTATVGSLQLRFNNDGEEHYQADGPDTNAHVILSLSDLTVESGVVCRYIGSANVIQYNWLSFGRDVMSGGGGCSTGQGIYTGCGLDSVTSIRVFGSQALNQGIQITLYGIRK